MMGKQRAAVFLDRDGVINKDTHYVSNPDALQIVSTAPSAIKRLNDAGYLTVLVTNQSGIARGFFTEADLTGIHDKLELELAKVGAKLDLILFCPHHPKPDSDTADTHYIKDCDCRKPKPGMIDQACKVYDIDLANSFLVGDSQRDIDCANKRGIKALGIYSGKETKLSAASGYFNSLDDAVNSILD